MSHRHLISLFSPGVDGEGLLLIARPKLIGPPCSRGQRQRFFIHPLNDG